MISRIVCWLFGHKWHSEFRGSGVGPGPWGYTWIEEKSCSCQRCGAVQEREAP